MTLDGAADAEVSLDQFPGTDSAALNESQLGGVDRQFPQEVARVGPRLRSPIVGEKPDFRILEQLLNAQERSTRCCELDGILPGCRHLPDRGFGECVAVETWLDSFLELASKIPQDPHLLVAESLEPGPVLDEARGDSVLIEHDDPGIDPLVRHRVGYILDDRVKAGHVTASLTIASSRNDPTNTGPGRCDPPRPLPPRTPAPPQLRTR